MDTLTRNLCSLLLVLLGCTDAHTRSQDGLQPSQSVQIRMEGSERTVEFAVVPSGPFWFGCRADDESCKQESPLCSNCQGGCEGCLDPRLREAGFVAELPTFQIMTTEVTLDMWQACETRGDCPSADIHTESEGSPFPTFEFVTRKSGFALEVLAADRGPLQRFCETSFAYGSLPTVAEWQKAARGPCQAGDSAEACRARAVAFPWGNAPTACQALECDVDCATEADCSCVVGSLQPKSRKQDASVYGVYDLGGGLPEAVTQAEDGASVPAGVWPLYAEPSPWDFQGPARSGACANRIGSMSTKINQPLGFRCVRRVPP